MQKHSEPLRDEWRNFGWHVIEVDGHNILELADAFEVANSIRGQPTVIIARTVKGKGVSFMENDSRWHGRPPNHEEYKRALRPEARFMPCIRWSR